MSQAGKIINIDAFKKKESGLASSKKPSKQGKGKGGVRNKNFVILLVISVSLALAIMMTPSKKASVKVLPLNSIAPYNIKASEDMLIEDKESTEKNKSQAKEAVLDVYDFDSRAEQNVRNKISEAFALMVSAYTTHAEQAYNDALAEFDSSDLDSGQAIVQPADPAEAEKLAKRYSAARAALTEFEKSEAFAKLEADFMMKLGLELDEKTIKSARYYHYRPQIGEIVASIVGPILSKGVIARKSQIPPSSARGITLRYLSTGAEKVIRNFEEIYDVPEANKKAREDIADIVSSNRPGLRNLASTIAEGMILPNITFNLKETELRKDKAEKAVQPVFFRVQRGEMIIREGERVQPTHIAKLEYMAGKEEDQGRLLIFAGLLLLNFLLVTLSSIFVHKFHEDVRDYPKLQLLLALLLVAHMGLIWTSAQVFTNFAPKTPGLGIKTYILAAPMAFGPMIVSIFFNTELTVLFTIVAAALTGLLLRDFSIPSLLTMTGGLVCAYQVRTYSKRSSVLRVGLLVALVNVMVIVAFSIMGAKFFSEDQISNIAFALLGGAVSALFVSGALPLVEGFFPVVSDIKLLEIANLDHPLLRRMLMEAPGTYHHSMMVGALA